jgi:dTMP kinase
MYLNGVLGERPDDVNAYAASSFFAADRYISYLLDWRSFYEKKDGVILANRYTTANAVHQLSKLPECEWEKFLDWLYDYEFEKLKIPKPDLTVFFDMHPEAAAKLIEERAKKTSQKKDIHESDFGYLKSCHAAGLFAAKYLSWEVVACHEINGAGVPVPKSEEEISESLFGLVKMNLQKI